MAEGAVCVVYVESYTLAYMRRGRVGTMYLHYKCSMKINDEVSGNLLLTILAGACDV